MVTHQDDVALLITTCEVDIEIFKNDELVATTIGGFLNTCDNDFRQLIIDDLVAYQTGEKQQEKDLLYYHED